MEQSSYPRRKRWAPKTKSGCLTCRARRVKCDESKPYCRRCLSLGRKCNYISTNGLTDESELVIPLEQPLHVSPRPKGVDSNPRETQIFDLLRTLTVHQLIGPFGQTYQAFWTVDALLATQAYPAIWHASLALSAMHHRMRLGKSEADQLLAKQYYTFSLTQYNISIRHLVDLTSKAHLSYFDKETVLFASILYVGICCAQRNTKDTKQAIAHIQNMLPLFYRWKFWELSPTSLGLSHTGRLHHDTLVQIIQYLEYQFDEFSGNFPGGLSRDLDRASTEPFKSVAEAYIEYVPLHYGTWICGGCPHPRRDDELQVRPFRDVKLDYVRRLRSWKMRFRTLERRAELERQDLHSIRLLRLLCDFEDIPRALYKEPKTETYWRHQHKFERLVDEAEALLQEAEGVMDLDTSSPVFSYSVNVCSVLRPLGIFCCNLRVRQRVIALLKRYPQRDLIWDGTLHTMFLEARVELEQGSLMRPVKEDDGVCGCVEGMFVCRFHRCSGGYNFLEAGGVEYTLRTGFDRDQNKPGTVIRVTWD